MINSQPARMPPQGETPGSAAILSRQIGEVVRRQRTLLLSVEVWEKDSSQVGVRCGADSKLGAERRCCRHGCAVSWLKARGSTDRRRCRSRRWTR